MKISNFFIMGTKCQHLSSKVALGWRNAMNFSKRSTWLDQVPLWPWLWIPLHQPHIPNALGAKELLPNFFRKLWLHILHSWAHIGSHSEPREGSESLSSSLRGLIQSGAGTGKLLTVFRCSRCSRCWISEATVGNQGIHALRWWL